jgi:hypothetical protein
LFWSTSARYGVAAPFVAVPASSASMFDFSVLSKSGIFMEIPQNQKAGRDPFSLPDHV